MAALTSHNLQQRAARLDPRYVLGLGSGFSQAEVQQLLASDDSIDLKSKYPEHMLLVRIGKVRARVIHRECPNMGLDETAARGIALAHHQPGQTSLLYVQQLFFKRTSVPGHRLSEFAVR